MSVDRSISIDKIDDYENEGNSILIDEILQGIDESVVAELYQQIEDYQNSYFDKVNQYIRNNEGIQDLSYLTINYKFFREKFVNYISDGFDKFEGCGFKLEDKKTNPEGAAVKLNKLLNNKGLELYQLALEEEANSKAYMNAVLLASTKTYKGKKWLEKPIELVGGPSGSGKSTQANKAVQKAQSSLKVDLSGNDVDNRMISVDGGICREISQIRKLVIKVAILKGYPGIIDLNNKSKVLEMAKSRIKRFALNKGNPHGVVMPETFSGIPIELISDIKSIKNRKLIFCTVKGKNDENFRSFINKLGNKRAWKRDFNGVEEDVDAIFQSLSNLNNKDGLPESKSYVSSGFYPGKYFTNCAGKIAKFDENALHLVAINDVICVASAQHSNEWQKATIQQESDSAINIKFISEDIFIAYRHRENKEERLEDFEKRYLKDHPLHNIFLANDLLANIVLELDRLIEKINDKYHMPILDIKYQLSLLEENSPESFFSEIK